MTGAAVAVRAARMGNTRVGSQASKRLSDGNEFRRWCDLGLFLGADLKNRS
jgi:hypothetical protein